MAAGESDGNAAAKSRIDHFQKFTQLLLAIGIQSK